MDTESIQNFLEQKGGFSTDIPIVLGVSGGADSLALMHILNEFDYSLVIGHLDHSLRPESKEEAEIVRQVAQSLDLSVKIKKVNIKEQVLELGLNEEEASRKARYRFLFELAKQHKAQAVFVAHHADDQAETIFMNLLRGAGATGLKGMQAISKQHEWGDNIPLVRPMLQIWRNEIEAFCKERKIDFFKDPSNQDTQFLRNKIRHDILPMLEKSNPHFKAALLQSSNIWEMDDLVLTQLSNKSWKDILISQDVKIIVISREKFGQLHLAIKRRIIRNVYFSLLGHTDTISFSAVSQAIDFLSTTNRNADLEWIAKVGIRLEEDNSYFHLKDVEAPISGPQIRENQIFQPDLSNTITLDNGWSFIMSIAKHENNETANYLDDNEYGIQCDLSEYPSLQMRPRKSGDRIQPLGLKKGSVKITDFMINEKMPERVRRKWPLLAKGNEILWVPGFRMSEKIRISKSSTRILQLIFNKS